MAHPAGTEVVGVRRRRRRRVAGVSWARLLVALAVLLGAAVTAGVVIAGSPSTLAAGVRISGVDVGGLTPKQARQLLERRFERVQHTPVSFTVAGRTFRVMPTALGIRPDFAAAVEAVRREGDGFGPIRGYRRLRVRLLGQDLQPHVGVWSQALELEIGRIASKVDRAPREAALVRHGLRVSAVAGRIGRVLDKEAAAQIIVRALASFDRSPVGLPMLSSAPRVTVAELAPALRQARLAVSAPVRLASGPTRWRLPRWRVAQLVDLPSGGRTTLRIGGDAADTYFASLAKRVDRPPIDARFAVSGPNVRIIPSKPGIGLDVPATAQALLVAATTPGGPRVARLVTARTQASQTTADAQKMGIVGLVSSYETFYGGVPNRLHNVQLVARLIDGTLIRPGEEFSFNKTTGARSAAKGFLEAPVIVNGELQTGLGGGVCQVSTTVFNVAFDAGLPITARTNHALYISHYPLARDATVDYPGVDLRFVNDTHHWLLLRTFVGTGSLVVSLYGTPQHRKVEAQTTPLVVTGPPPLQKVKDPTLPKGEKVVESSGVSSTSTSVRRRVFSAGGQLLSDSTWYSSYRAEPKIVRIGTKKEPAKKDAVTGKGKAKEKAKTPPAQSPLRTPKPPLSAGA